MGTRSMNQQPRRIAPSLAAMAAAALLVGAAPATALVIVNQVGTEAPGGSSPGSTPGIENTLSGGVINDADGDLGWTHTYTPVPLGEVILQATLTIDLIDADDGFLDLYAGTDTSGLFIDSAVGIDHGSVNPWRDLQTAPPTGSFDQVLTIGAAHYADLMDGTFEIYGDNRQVSGSASMGAWGSNRAILTIVTGVPEPQTALLLGTGLAVLALRRRGF